MFKKKKLLIMGIASIAIASSAIVVGVTRGSVVKSDDDTHSIIFNKDSIDEEDVILEGDYYSFTINSETALYHEPFSSVDSFFYISEESHYDVKYNNYILRIVDNTDYTYGAMIWISFDFKGPGILIGGSAVVDIDGEETILVLDDPDSSSSKYMCSSEYEDYTGVIVTVATEENEHIIGLKSIELNYTCN